MSMERKKSYIIEALRKNGCRITSQRQLLIDIILQRSEERRVGKECL